MNKKNKGFTTIELITSFTLASVIMLILFNIILILKDNLSKVNAKTNMLVEKDNLSYNINKRFKEKELSSVTLCNEGDKCYEFKYSDDTSDKLVYSNTDKSITFNNYTFDIIDGITVEEPTITEHYDTMSSTTYNGYFIINIPIKLDNKDYSIKINKHFNTDSLVMDIGNYYDNNGNRYTKVEYLESTGTQYIITNIIATSGTWNISAKFKATSQYNRGSLFGSTNGFNITIDTDKVYRATGQVITIIEPSTEKFDNLNLSINTFDNKIQLSINNNIFSGTYSNWIYNNNMGICAWGDAQYNRSGMYKEIVFVHNNVTVGYFIPVIDSSSRPCFFDKVEKKCYYNQGEGEFLYG